MKTQEINIRDPYVLVYQGVYYLYGTRSATCWGEMDGFDCYTSTDLEEWNGPFEVFHRPEGFFADRNYWAPECYHVNDRFYLFATLGCETRKKGVYALVADSPLGPFEPTGDAPLTPAEWTCIDGSLYWDEKGTPWLLFSHSFEDEPRGDMCGVKLTGDLCHGVGEPVILFSAEDAPWATPVPFARAEFGIEGDVYFTDGPCAHRMADGSLVILWASWSDRGYAVGAAVSPSGDISGPWEHRTEKVFPENGGHGMLLKTLEGRLLYTLHYPNDWHCEHPVFMEITEQDGTLKLKNLSD